MTKKIIRAAEVFAGEIEFIERGERHRRMAEAGAKRLVTPDEYRDQLLNRVNNGDEVVGFKMPWEKTHDHFRFKKQTVTLLAGMSGHMKSTTLSQIALHLCKETRVGIMSLEMSIVDQLVIMAQQFVARDAPKERDADRMIQYLKGQMWFYDSTEVTDAERVYSALCAMHQLGIEFVVLDNLQMFIGKLDNEAETEFIKEVRSMAIAFDMAICLVHHVRKPPDGAEDRMPSKQSVRGSGGLTDIAHHVLIVFHNKARAEALSAQADGETLSEAQRKLLAEEVDYRIHVAKNRSNKFEGSFALFSGNGRTLKEYSDSDDCRVMAPA